MALSVQWSSRPSGWRIEKPGRHRADVAGNAHAPSLSGVPFPSRAWAIVVQWCAIAAPRTPCERPTDASPFGDAGHLRAAAFCSGLRRWAARGLPNAEWLIVDASPNSFLPGSAQQRFSLMPHLGREGLPGYISHASTCTEAPSLSRLLNHSSLFFQVNFGRLPRRLTVSGARAWEGASCASPTESGASWPAPLDARPS